MLQQQPHPTGSHLGSDDSNGTNSTAVLNSPQRVHSGQNPPPGSDQAKQKTVAQSSLGDATSAQTGSSNASGSPTLDRFGGTPAASSTNTITNNNSNNSPGAGQTSQQGQTSPVAAAQQSRAAQPVPSIQPSPLAQISQEATNHPNHPTLATFTLPHSYLPSSPAYGFLQLHPIQKLQRLHQAKNAAVASASGSTSPVAPPAQTPPSQTAPQPPQHANPTSTKVRDENGDFKPRMRVVKACDRCRTHKIKCSGEQPCATCSRQKKECVFSVRPPPQKRPARKHESSPELKRPKVFQPFGLPQVEKSDSTHYVKHLENRVQYLESLLATDSVRNFKIPDTAEPEGEYVDETLFTTSSKWRFSRRHQNLLIVELCKSMYSNLSEELQQLVTLPRTQYFGWNMSGVNYVGSEELPDLPELNGENVNDDFLIKYFFEEINPLFGILHEVVFKEQLAAYDKLLREDIMSLDKDDRDSKANQTRLFSGILYLVFALAIRFSEILKPKSPDISLLKLEERLFKYGYKVVSILSFEWESFELIQAWLLITLYLRVTHRQTSCSHALGEAVTMVKSMGLGYSDENPKIYNSTPYEKLKAKRLFWAVFSLDRVFGLQLGRYSGIREEDFTVKYPSMDYAAESTNDLWLTPESLAMIHIARIANFVHTLTNDNPHYVKYQQVNTELIELNNWLNNNGFRNDLLFNKNKKDSSSLIKAQVKLHYYDLVLCIHSKVLFNYVGRRIASHGLKVEMVIDACNGIVEVLDKTNKAGLLYTPWYSVMMLLFNIGVNAITLINAGVMINQARDILKNSIRLLTIIRKSPIRDEQNKLIFRERFKMVRECMWALKMANRMLTLRLQEDIGVLNGIGVDHGSSDVNKQHFTQLGTAVDAEDAAGNNNLPSAQRNQFTEVFEKQVRRSTENRQARDASILESPASQSSDPMPLNSGDPVDTYSSVEIDNLLSNLQWFDQWTDFNLDF
ncbi:putative transcriptional regulatory protein STB4 [Candida viswanathii]|uniref:Putative transcriptional regulatory protein STB4 n=1 Tax=Candida viswanathii TaxID=5486 RepID=A0A367YGW5_9ASCO|nr:putative transcriptional regulatory protein STB4 [Candida viswanathii]